MLKALSTFGKERESILAMAMYTYSRYGKIFGPIDDSTASSVEQSTLIAQWNYHWYNIMKGYKETTSASDKIRQIDVKSTGTCAIIMPWCPTIVPENVKKVFVLSPITTIDSKIILLQPAMPIEQLEMHISLPFEHNSDIFTLVDTLEAVLPADYHFDTLAKAIESKYQIVVTRLHLDG